MKRIIGMAEIEDDSLHLAVFQIKGKHISLLAEESLGPSDVSNYPGLEVWLIVRTRDRSVRYVTLPKNARRQAREMAMMQASPQLLLPPEEYAYDALVKPVGDKLGAMLIAIPLAKAHAWEQRLERAGLVLISFAIEPLFYPLLRPQQRGKVTFCMPTPQGSLAIIGCHNGTPVCWSIIQDESRIPSGGLENMLVRNYFCEAPEPFVPEKMLAGETSLEPRLVGYLAAAHLAALSPRPWEGRSLLAFSEFLKREQYAPATKWSVLKCLAAWAVAAALLLLAGIAHVNKVEIEAKSLTSRNEELQALAVQSKQAAKEISELRELRNHLRELTLDKRMVLNVLRLVQDALPLRVRLTGLRYDAVSGVQAECVAEREQDILNLLGNLGKLPKVGNLQLLFAEARDDGQFHFRISFILDETEVAAAPASGGTAQAMAEGKSDAAL